MATRVLSVPVNVLSNRDSDNRENGFLQDQRTIVCVSGSIMIFSSVSKNSPETEAELCLSVSCKDMGQQWPATGVGALSAADLGMTKTLLEEVTINPIIEPPELTQYWGNRVLEGTNRTLCAPGPRREEQ